MLFYMSKVANNISTRKSVRVESLIQHDYAERVAAFRRARGAWKGLRINHVKELARLRRERDRKLPSFKSDR